MESAGHVLIIEGKADRLVRLRAPAAPAVTAPAFANQPAVTVTGSAEPGSLVQAFRDAVNSNPLASTAADAATGAFTLSVPLAANTENMLLFTATSAGGVGLTSPATSRTIVHDDRLPVTTILEPPAGTHAHAAFTVTARGEDDGSGVAGLTVAIDGQPRGEASNPDPAQAFTASFVVDTTVVAEGPHALEVTARDRAGNSSAAAQPFIVDRTPPDTQIVIGPGAETAETAVTFTVTGTDAIASSDALTFAWRVDEAPWSPFNPETAITVGALTAGAHRFEVKARDLAGNEDPTPAVQAFSVTSLSVRIIEPAAGAVIATDMLLVRGTVESGAADVTVVVPLPPELRDAFGASELPASVEAGTFAIQLPIAQGMTAVTVIATGADGASVRDQVSISVVQTSLTEVQSGLRPSPPVGFAPHTVHFGASQSIGSTLALDLEGDGTIDYQGATLQEQIFTYARPGVYAPILRETTPEGVVFTYRTFVNVYDRAALDARLQSAWTGFKNALQAGDVTAALGYVHSHRRQAWGARFDRLTPEQLATASLVFTAIELVEVRPGLALCDMLREDSGQMYSFPVEFALDTDGRWRLWQF